jgi:hypothetical protein
MSGILRAAAAWLAGPKALAADGWLRDGVPRPLIALTAILSPLCWSGPLRTLTAWPLSVTLLLGLGLTLGLVAILWPSLARPRPRSWAWTASFVAIALLVPLLLYDRWFGGLTVIVDGDSGMHVFMRDDFVRRNPDEYAGFVSFYALTWWIERLGANAYVSFALAFYAAALAYAVAPLVAASVVLAPPSPVKSERAGLAVAVAATALLLYFVALPLFHYHQSEGFFAQVFAIAVLMGLWLADATVRPARLRLALLGAGVVAYRYSYALTLGDLLIAIALVCLVDTRQLSSRLWGRLAVVTLAAALGLAAFMCYRALTPLWHKEGWITEPDRPRALIAQWLLVATFAAALGWPWARRRVAGRGLGRWLRLPIALGLVNALMLTWLAIRPPPTHYYATKYSLHALWLLGAAAVPLLVALAAGPATPTGPATPAGAPASGRARFAAVVLAALTIGSGVLVTRSIAVYRPGFLERAFGRPPFSVLKPLADLGAWSRIDRVLLREHKQFGGYLTTWYPMMNFMNAAFGYFNGGIHFYWGRPAVEAPGYCVFWEGGAPASWLEASFPQDGRRARWERDPAKQCVSYHAHWKPELTRTLCWRCR